LKRVFKRIAAFVETNGKLNNKKLQQVKEGSIAIQSVQLFSRYQQQFSRKPVE